MDHVVSEVAQKSFRYMVASANSVTNLDVHNHHMTHIHNMKSNQLLEYYEIILQYQFDTMKISAYT